MKPLVVILVVSIENKNEHNTQLVAQRSDYDQLNLITNFNF